MRAPQKKYSLIIRDDARLQTILSWSVTPARVLLAAGLTLVLIFAMGFLFVLLTPVKTLIPGYFRASERAATEQAMLRMDSVMDAYNRNEAYLGNLRMVLDTDRPAARAVIDAEATPEISADSLLPPSPAETRFVRMMQDREKFNISLAAPLAAEGMRLYPVCDEGVVTPASRESTTARILLPEGASVMALADGAVLSVYYDQGSHGYALIIQHDNGFVSRYSGLGTPLIGKSDQVKGGQVLCTSPRRPASAPAEIGVELWHDGTPLPPYRYISSLHAMPSSDINPSGSAK